MFTPTWKTTGTYLQTINIDIHYGIFRINVNSLVKVAQKLRSCAIYRLSGGALVSNQIFKCLSILVNIVVVTPGHLGAKRPKVNWLPLGWDVHRVQPSSWSSVSQSIMRCESRDKVKHHSQYILRFPQGRPITTDLQIFNLVNSLAV